MRPAEAEVILGHRIGNQLMIEQEEVQRLSCDENIVHFVQRIVSDVDAVDEDEDDAQDVANACQPFCDVVAEGGLVVYAVDRVCWIFAA